MDDAQAREAAETDMPRLRLRFEVPAPPADACVAMAWAIGREPR